MARSAKFISFLFLLSLFFSMQIHARESQFFSKVTNVNTNAKEKTVVLPNKEETLSKQEQEPTFIPETQGGYGLYGHESGQLPPTNTLTNANGAPYTTTPTDVQYKTQFTTPTDVPYKTQFTTPSEVQYKTQFTTPTEVPYKTQFTTPTNVPYKNVFEDEESLNKYLNTNDDINNNNYNNNYYYNKNSNGASQNGLVDTRLTERGYTTTANQNNYYNGANQYNVEKQGMSDTRFLENGKFYYNPHSQNYNPNQYGNSRVVNQKNWYGNKGYYGNNENSFENNNSMEGYQNEEEFQEERDEFVP